MSNLVMVLIAIFGGLALLVVILERTAKPMEPEQMQRISRWILPLVGLSLLLGALRHFWQG
ncbi:hypothetical protein F0M18_03235 [Pseudohalioglobus sediminis]|uniref:Uncharacterized protein n=1 Tax=Pseudohalioglobus sediminis TaxID=2606449 RepID=A0A5B0X564_9GAMM|nr:hypothetical protein [Pseudohalioglobus sediminis]KAA1194456.1 hypothetical protein F0M18_03235 [Pseudohalioglobus sediminis]